VTMLFVKLMSYSLSGQVDTGFGLGFRGANIGDFFRREQIIEAVKISGFCTRAGDAASKRF